MPFNVPAVARRMADTARDVAREIDEFGAAWEGAEMRDVREETARSRYQQRLQVGPVSVGTGTLLLIGAVFLLAMWR